MRKPSLPRSRKALAALVGSRIRKLRQDRGWSQSDLAALLSLPPSSIKRYETRGLLPKAHTLYRMALLFGTGAGSLLDESSAAARNPRLLRLIARIELLDDETRDAAADLLETLVSGLEPLVPLLRR